MITPMKKVSLVCMKEDREKILCALQHSELIMLTPSDNGVSGRDKGSSANQRKLDTLLKELSKFTKKKGLFQELPEVEQDRFESISDSSVEEMHSAEGLLSLKDALEVEISDLSSRISELKRWSAFKKDVLLLGQSEYTVNVLGRIPTQNLEQLSEIQALATEELEREEKESVILVSFLKSENILSSLRELSFEEANVPLKSGIISEEIKRLKELLSQKEKEKGDTLERISELTKKSKGDLELLFEQYKALTERSEVRLPETVETVVFEGWVREDEVEKLREAIDKVTDLYDIEARDPLEDEEVPTSLTNKKLVSQFEGITDMFNSPRYRDYDPNAVMAPWYWIIFGMMMGDAGYGLMMAVLIFLAKKIMKPKGSTLKLINVLLYSSVTTIIFGILFGSYFGEELFPALIGFTALDDPISMLILTLVVGVLHIFTGMITKMYLDIKNGHFWDAIFDQLSWMMVILGLGLIFIPPLSKIGPVLSIIGALIILFTAGRNKKGVVGKLMGGLGGLYNITAYFSDILSYSRILALSLATGVVGMVMNLLAGMVQGSVIGFIFSLVIYIVGHVFNLVLGLLSAYVHSCRLQYIEFYGKFYEGGGTLFRPFGIKTNYINIKKD